MICQSRQRLSSTNFTWSILKYLVDTSSILKYIIETSTIVTAINSWQRCVSCKSQSSNLLYKLMDWFLYDRVNLIRHERVKVYELISTNSRSCFHKYVFAGSKGLVSFNEPFINFTWVCLGRMWLFFSAYFKLVSAICYQIFIFSSNDSPLKTMKNVLYFI